MFKQLTDGDFLRIVPLLEMVFMSRECIGIYLALLLGLMSLVHVILAIM